MKWIAGSLVALLLIPALATAQEVRVRDLMTAQQFRAAGLHKLTVEEMAALDQWVVEFALRVLGTTQTDQHTGAVVESRIDGEFTGWTGETLFQLQNGQIWQQTSYAYHYHYAYSPQVLIYTSGGRYKMKVDGVASEIYVRRLR